MLEIYIMLIFWGAFCLFLYGVIPFVIALALGPIGIVIFLLYLAWWVRFLKHERNKRDKRLEELTLEWNKPPHLRSSVIEIAPPAQTPAPVKSEGLDLADIALGWMFWKIFK